jgi:hypothetical protein
VDSVVVAAVVVAPLNDVAPLPVPALSLGMVIETKTKKLRDGFDATGR